MPVTRTKDEWLQAAYAQAYVSAFCPGSGKLDSSKQARTTLRYLGAMTTHNFSPEYSWHIAPRVVHYAMVQCTNDNEGAVRGVAL